MRSLIWVLVNLEMVFFPEDIESCWCQLVMGLNLNTAKLGM